MPVAIIQNGTKDTQKKVIGKVSSISKLVAEHQLSSPAIIVIGEVVNHTSELSVFTKAAYSDDEFIFQNLNVTE